MTHDEIVSSFQSRFGEALIAQNDFRGEKTLSIKMEALRDVALFCHRDLGFDYLVDVSSLDHFGDTPRFEMVYELYSMASGVHLRLKALVADDDEPLVPSISDIWPTADWHEREVYDMMGIRFEGHADMRRILMWDGYPFYPLRKDFPLQGKPSETEEVAFSEVAPLAGGPFVTAPTDGTSQVREPRARHAGDEPLRDKFLAEP